MPSVFYVDKSDQPEAVESEEDELLEDATFDLGDIPNASIDQTNSGRLGEWEKHTKVSDIEMYR